MEKPTSVLLLLVLISLSGVLSQESLDGKAFVFPTPSSNSYVLLHPALKEQLQNFTICLRFFTDLTRSFALVSMASQQHDNEIVLFKQPNEYEVWVGGQCVDFRAPGNMDSTNSHWGNICTTWDSTTGLVQLWLDGQPLPRKGIAKGYKVQTDVVMMLGQDQDSYGGSLDAGQSFVGEMAEVYMWDTVLPPEQLRRTRKNIVPIPLVDWTALEFDMKGYVVMEPIL